MASPVYRGLLAPSPTCKLHLGTARMSLVVWLAACKAGGALVLRIEGLDGPRVVQGCAGARHRTLAVRRGGARQVRVTTTRE